MESSGSERDPDFKPGPSKPSHQSTTTPTVPKTPNLSQHPKQQNIKKPNYYSEHGFVGLVAEPSTYKKAMASLDSDAWQHAIMEEHQALLMQAFGKFLN